MKTILHTRKVALVAFGLAFGASNLANAAAPLNFWGTYTTSSFSARDITKPVPEKSYFTTSVEPTADGANLIVEIYHGKLNSPVSLSLQVAINDGSGNEVVKPITFKQLDDKVADNPVNYYSRREFRLTYADLNAELAKILPPAAKNVVIGPGTPLFVFAQFNDYNHQWGSIYRGGIFFMPEDANAAASGAVASAVSSRRPEELDLAYPIPQTLAFKYNNFNLPGNPGLKVGGQIRSRVESEGKYQIPESEKANIRKQLFALANDPALAAQVLGADWTIAAEMKYMKKDPVTKAVLLDAEGLPTPDPMVDTYYDNDSYDAAKNDMAIRYRWTEGNGTGAWNFKPGLTHASPDGIVDRIEFGVDTTDDKPESVASFADSTDPLNPFRMIREVVPGSTPSDFLKPAVKITDTRYKFKLTHKNGLVIEVSLDDVISESLRVQNTTANFVQLEMDIDHLSTASQNVAGAGNFTFFGDLSKLTPADLAYLATLNEKAFLDGRPAIHNSADLDPASPVKLKHEQDFKTAGVVIGSLREHLLGKNWIPGAQKNAFATMALGLVDKADASTSVKATLRREAEIAAETATPSVAAPAASPEKIGLLHRIGIALCPSAFN